MINKKKFFIFFHYALQFISRSITTHKNSIRDCVLRYAGGRKSLALDFGCGEGIFSDIFRNDKNITFVEADNNADLLLFSKCKNKNNSYVVSDERLCFRKSVFDFVILNNVLHHMTQEGIAQLLFEISRILSKTGYLIIMEMVPRDQQKAFHFKIITFVEEKVKKIQYFNPHVLNKFLNQFTLIEERRIRHNFVQYVFTH